MLFSQYKHHRRRRCQETIFILIFPSAFLHSSPGFFLLFLFPSGFNLKCESRKPVGPKINSFSLFVPSIPDRIFLPFNFLCEGWGHLISPFWKEEKKTFCEQTLNTPLSESQKQYIKNEFTQSKLAQESFYHSLEQIYTTFYPVCSDNDG